MNNEQNRAERAAVAHTMLCLGVRFVANNRIHLKNKQFLQLAFSIFE